MTDDERNETNRDADTFDEQLDKINRMTDMLDDLETHEPPTSDRWLLDFDDPFKRVPFEMVSQIPDCEYVHDLEDLVTGELWDEVVIALMMTETHEPPPVRRDRDHPDI